jgi:hypothetical protein
MEGTTFPDTLQPPGIRPGGCFCWWVLIAPGFRVFTSQWSVKEQ